MCLCWLRNGRFLTLEKISSPLPILLRADALQAREELAERRGVGKMEAVGNLGDAQWGGLQQKGGLHQQHLVDVVDDGAAGDLTDDAGEIDC